MVESDHEVFRKWKLNDIISRMNYIQTFDKVSHDDIHDVALAVQELAELLKEVINNE